MGPKSYFRKPFLYVHTPISLSSSRSRPVPWFKLVSRPYVYLHPYLDLCLNLHLHLYSCICVCVCMQVSGP